MSSAESSIMRRYLLDLSGRISLWQNGCFAIVHLVSSMSSCLMEWSMFICESKALMRFKCLTRSWLAQLLQLSFSCCRLTAHRLHHQHYSKAFSSHVVYLFSLLQSLAPEHDNRAPSDLSTNRFHLVNLHRRFLSTVIAVESSSFMRPLP